MRLFVAVLSLVMMSCGHAPIRCDIDHVPPIDREWLVEVDATLVGSPTWRADLLELSHRIGRSKVACLVEADVEALMRVANRSTDDSFVVAPHLAIGVERGREWVKDEKSGTCSAQEKP